MVAGVFEKKKPEFGEFSTIEFGEFSKLNLWVLSLDFFEERMRLEILNLNLENSPDSTLEFAEFSQVREIFLLNLSLENSPNSALELREFSKLILVFEKNVFWILFFF